MKSQLYDTCRQGCKLFEINDTEDPEEVCIHCNNKRYMDNSDVLKPFSTLKMMSVGELIASKLADDKTRQQLVVEYPEKDVAGTMTDIHDSEVFRDYRRKIQTGTDIIDIFLMLFVDGFVNQRKGKKTFTIFHVHILNINASER